MSPSDSADQRGAPPPRPADDRARTTTVPQAPRCDLCGHPMRESHCKLICDQCGYIRDCSDP